MSTYRTTRIHMGADALEFLTTLRCRVLIVTDPYMATTEFLTRVKAKLADSEIEVFADVTPDPALDLVIDGLRVFKRAAPDAIVAVGGGSPIDTAKAIYKLALEQGDRPAKGLIAIPTTSGTGSEVTSFAIVTDRKNQTKMTLISDDMLPDHAVLDPAAVMTVPPKVTADTGMDTTTHVIESYVSTKANDFTDAGAEKALQLVFAHLLTAYRNGSDFEAREHMHNAACLAGIGFDNAGLGICHSLAHSIGGHFHVAHGRLNAMLLPHVMLFNAGDMGFGPNGLSPTARRYAHLAFVTGIRASTPRNMALGLVDAVRKLVTDLDIVPRITANGVDKADFLTAIPDVVANALRDACTTTNPRQPTAEDLEQILRAIV